MTVIDLKTSNLEQILVNEGISQDNRIKISKDVCYFDEFYLTSFGKIVNVFRQEFVKDPYMDLCAILKVRLIAYQSGIDLSDLKEIFNREDISIITRANRSNIGLFRDFGFREIKNIDGNLTTLIPIKFRIPAIESLEDESICLMSKENLDEIEELFRKEYSLRYRMVRIMYQDCPEACFVYKDKEKIIGVTFNKIDNNELYMRQIFVRENSRGGGVGRVLYNRRLDFARRLNLKFARANVRREAIELHRKYNPKMVEEDMEYYVVKKF